MGERCTWAGCKLPAHHAKVSSNGQWAHLCDRHDREYEELRKAFMMPPADSTWEQRVENTQKLMQAWTMAQGGREVAMGRVERKAAKIGQAHLFHPERSNPWTQ